MAKKNIFVTGIAGFAGSYLSELLLDKDYNIFGLLAPGEKTANINHIKKDINLERFNLLNGNRLTKYIQAIKPDYIIHLAAFASVGQSFDNERLVYDINFTGTLNLIASVLQLSKKPAKLVFISSSDVYGLFKPDGKTLTESQSFNPQSPYAISKASGEYLIRYHHKKNDLPAVIVRAFNHTGPRQNDAYVVPAFSRQVARIEAGRQKPLLSVGDLSARRDLSDVRDIVRGYYSAAIKGKPGDVYQLCSGKSVEIKTVLEKLVGYSDMSIKIKVDKSRFRKTDIPVLRGSNKYAKLKLGWQPEYKLNETLKDTLEYWRKKEM